VNLEACLPAELRGPATTITKVAAGLSRAGVYRVESGGRTFALKIAGEGVPTAAWRRQLHIQQLAANAGLAPRIVHTDEACRSVVSEFVADRSFPRRYGDPRTREAAVTQLGLMLRRVHDLPLPADADGQEPVGFLTALWSGLGTDFPLPPFVVDAVRRVLDERAPVQEGAPVLSHNDVNPSNLLHDGENLLLVDWESAGANDPFYDLAAISVFAIMDDATCRRLLAAHDGRPVSSLPARFVYTRQLVAALGGAMFLTLARRSGHAGATGGETLGSTPSLGEFYQRMQSGALSIATQEGQWWFGLALVKTSIALGAGEPREAL
jgi:hypothetical protein